MKYASKWIITLLCVLFLVSCSNSNAVNEEAINNDEWETPADLTPKKYAEKGYLVNLHGKITNFAEMERFIENVNAHKPDQITTVAYTIEGAPIFHQVVYDGRQFSYVYDDSWDAYAGDERGIKEGTCSDFAIVKKERGTSYRLTGCTGELEATEVLFR